jgi:hypothetical protein
LSRLGVDVVHCTMSTMGTSIMRVVMTSSLAW